jgi:PAS domain S-box-containing protein
MKTQNNHVQSSQADNGINGSFDCAAMVNGLVSLCDDSEMVICLDNKGLVKNIKTTALKKFLNNGAELIGKCIWDFLPPETVESRKAVFLEVLKTGKAIRYEGAHNGRWIDNMVYPVFDKQGNVRQVIVMGRDITHNKRTEEEIRRLNKQLELCVIERTAELEEKTRNLEEVNNALRVLLQKNIDEKKERQQYMLSAVNQTIIPYVCQIQQRSTDPQILTCIDAIKSNLKDFTIEFHSTIRSKAFNLTPAELEVALLIKVGKGSKDIAQMLKVSSETIDFHRKNIRKKLGIQHKKQNLQSYLASLDT